MFVKRIIIYLRQWKGRWQFLKSLTVSTTVGLFYDNLIVIHIQVEIFSIE